MSETPKLRRSKKAARFDADNELWETRKLGASPEHARVVSGKGDKALDESMGLQLLTFRIQKPIVDQLRQLAKLEGIGYQPLMRQVLVKYVRENQHRLQRILTPHEASERAEQLFTQAIKYKKIIATLAPMTNERLGAESDFSTSLGGANALYCQAKENCSDPVLKKHLKLRLSQVETLLNEVSRPT
jgi:hypothetical protein